MISACIIDGAYLLDVRRLRNHASLQVPQRNFSTEPNAKVLKTTSKANFSLVWHIGGMGKWFWPQRQAFFDAWNLLWKLDFIVWAHFQYICLYIIMVCRNKFVMHPCSYQGAEAPKRTFSDTRTTFWPLLIPVISFGSMLYYVTVFRLFISKKLLKHIIRISLTSSTTIS